jgi:large subunit ribosomal protein L18
MDKKTRRLRRATKTRAKIRELLLPRLTIHKTPKHIYAQVINGTDNKVVAVASTVQKGVIDGDSSSGNIDAAKTIGKLIAERSLDAGVKKVAFDRSGFKYHGRVQALADSAREAGLEF